MIRKILLAAFLASTAGPARANDTVAYNKTGGLEFAQTVLISMEEERLYISARQVRVDYVFKNTSDQTVDGIIAFPMPDLAGSYEQNIDSGDIESDNPMEFSVVQDGVAIKPKLQQRVLSTGIDMTDIVKAAGIPMSPLSSRTAEALKTLPDPVKQDWIARGLMQADNFDDGSGEKTAYTPLWTLKSTFYWRSSFPAGKDIHVSHTYKPSVGGTVALTYLEDNQPKGERYTEYKKKYCIDDAFVKLAQKANARMDGQSAYFENWISYVLTTGANWQGPIRKFTLIVDKGAADNRVSFCGKNVHKTSATTFEMTATDFEPEQDIDILLLTPSK